MGRDRMRVLLCAIAAIVLIIAGAVVMDWYRASFSQLMRGMPGLQGSPLDGARVSLDLRNLYICHARGCVATSISPMPGMFPTLATVTMWASLALAALVAYQTATRVLAGAANESFSKLGYALALLAIALAVVTAFVFGPEDQGDMTDMIAQAGLSLPRTWAPLVLIAGLATGFAALYMAITAEPAELGTGYKPVVLDQPILPIAVARHRTPTGVPPIAGDAAVAMHDLTASSDSLPAIGRSRTMSIPPVPAHLRNRLAYLAVTAELTAGGIDARREDGSSKLILWRDVVGVVARRLPPDYDSATFIDIVSTAGSTLRIVPWTRLMGEPVVGEGDDRPRGVVERVVARCPDAKVDPATRLFLETGEAAQLPDRATLEAHDQRLA